MAASHETELERLYRARFEAFLFTATAYLGDRDAAWDVVHDAFAQALKRRRSLRREASLEAWVWKILLNLARDHARRRSDAALPARRARGDESGSADAAASVREGITRLPERQRLAVFLRYYADLDYDTIAGLLGVSAGTVAASLNAARTTLRARLQEVPE